MENKGILRKCDRCGLLRFCEVKAERETDGGYTRWTEFVEPPEQWERFTILGNRVLLCNLCANTYKTELEKMERTFMQAVKAPDTEEEAYYLQIFKNTES